MVPPPAGDAAMPARMGPGLLFRVRPTPCRSACRVRFAAWQGLPCSCNEPPSQGPQCKECKQGGGDIEDGSDEEDELPTSGSGREQICQRHDEGGRALGGVEQTIIGGREFLAVEIGAQGGEQSVDLTPGEEHKTREDHKQERLVCKREQSVDGEPFEEEREKHRVFATDMV